MRHMSGMRRPPSCRSAAVNVSDGALPDRTRVSSNTNEFSDTTEDGPSKRRFVAERFAPVFIVGC